MSRDPDLDDFLASESDGDDAALPGFALDPMGVLRRRWKWMFHLDAERQELYDLASDPGEQEDLVAAGTADPEMLREFGDLLRNWLASGRNEQLNATPVDNQMLDESMIESLRSLGYIE